MKENVELWIIGSGPEERSLKELSDSMGLKKIKFWGQVRRGKLESIMSQGSVLVLPSLSEGFPNVILEAMSRGLPIIATDVGGVREILKDNRNGFIVPPKNIKEMMKKILLLMNSESIRRRMSKNNLKDVKKYSWGNVAKKLEVIYGL